MYQFTPQSKEASEHTKFAQEQLRSYLNFDDTEDFILAKRGLLLQKEQVRILGEDGKTVIWDMDRYQFLQGDCPDTVNPSLWRISQLNTIHGLFEVVPGVYQVRGYDISYMTFIQGERGWICVDPITTVETARAAKALLDEYFGPRPISAVLHTHGHKDHYAGIKGIVSQEEVESGTIKIYVPDHFLESAVSENVYAGQAMGRRSTYVYGSMLPCSPVGNVGNGIGMTSPLGTSSLIIPTDIIKEDEMRTIDGVDFVFILAPETEAPAEFMFYLPKCNALCTAELTNACLHNIYTIRGAEIRDAKAWAEGIDRLISRFGDELSVVFMTHHWPRWGRDICKAYLENQRDLYKFLHDQTLHLANSGYTPEEIGDNIRPPKALDTKWYSRGYHGSLSHNARGIYQKYLGFWDGNPATLNKLPTSKSARLFVDMMGGKEAVLEKSLSYFAIGEYRFLAEVLNYVVFAYPQDKNARYLLADTLEQLGYQSENGTWRNVYLTGAMELRNFSPSYHPEQYPDFQCITPESIRGLTGRMMLDYLAIKLDGQAAEGLNLGLNLLVKDRMELFSISLKNAALTIREVESFDKIHPVLTLSHATLGQIILSVPECTLERLPYFFDGDVDELKQFFSLFQKFPFWFNIIEAR